MLAFVVGLVGLFVDAIPTDVAMISDTLAYLLSSSGGFIWSVRLEFKACTEDNAKELFSNPLLNGGCDKLEPPSRIPHCGVPFTYPDKPEVGNAFWSGALESKCERAHALETCLWALSLLSSLLVLLGIMMQKRKGEKSWFN